MRALQKPVKEMQDIPAYLQRSLPAIILTETSDFLKSVFDQETGGCFVQKKILDYESKKMQEFIKDYQNSDKFQADDINHGIWTVMRDLYKVEPKMGVIPFKKDFSIDYERAERQRRLVEKLEDKIEEVERQIKKFEPKKKSSALLVKLMEFDHH